MLSVQQTLDRVVLLHLELAFNLDDLIVVLPKLVYQTLLVLLHADLAILVRIMALGIAIFVIIGRIWQLVHSSFACAGNQVALLNRHGVVQGIVILAVAVASLVDSLRERVISKVYFGSDFFVGVEKHGVAWLHAAHGPARSGSIS